MSFGDCRSGTSYHPIDNNNNKVPVTVTRIQPNLKRVDKFGTLPNAKFYGNSVSSFLLITCIQLEAGLMDE
jgi:hypothetical protein